MKQDFTVSDDDIIEMKKTADVVKQQKLDFKVTKVKVFYVNSTMYYNNAIKCLLIGFDIQRVQCYIVPHATMQ